MTLFKWTKRRLLTRIRFRPFELRIHHRSVLSRDGAADERARSLSSTFFGSPAWTTLNTAEALTLARKLGNPLFLITPRFNPNWPEVRAELIGQNAQLESILCTRVFRCRLHKLLGLIKKNFGITTDLISVIEFQKRGFPHAHLIIRFHPPLPFEEVDQVASLHEANQRKPEQRIRASQLAHMQYKRQHLRTDSYPRCRSADGHCKYGFFHDVRGRVRRSHICLLAMTDFTARQQWAITDGVIIGKDTKTTPGLASQFLTFFSPGEATSTSILSFQ